MRHHDQRLRTRALGRVQAEQLLPVAGGEFDRAALGQGPGLEPGMEVEQLASALLVAVEHVHAAGFPVRPGPEEHLAAVAAEAAEGKHLARERLHQSCVELGPLGVRLDVLQRRLVRIEIDREGNSVHALVQETVHRHVAATGELGARPGGEVDAISLRRLQRIADQGVDRVVVLVETHGADGASRDGFG